MYILIICIFGTQTIYIMYNIYNTIMKIIGTSKVAAQKKITLIESVAILLNITIGDRIAYLKSTSGNIVIKKLSDIEMKDSEEQT